MKHVKIMVLAMALLLMGAASASASWYIDSSVAASHLGGPSQMGPYATQAQANAVIAASPNYGLKLMPGGFDDGPGGGSSSGGSPSSGPPTPPPPPAPPKPGQRARPQQQQQDEPQGESAPVQKGFICPMCQGAGTIDVVCPQCGGTGIAGWATVNGQTRAPLGCEKCGGVRGDPANGVPGRKGSGRVTIPCPLCRGSGATDSPYASSAMTRKIKRFIEIDVDEDENSAAGAGPKGSNVNLWNSNSARPAAPEPDDSSVVDLRRLDPNKPIVVDPNVVKGEVRVFQVQPTAPPKPADDSSTSVDVFSKPKAGDGQTPSSPP